MRREALATLHRSLPPIQQVATIERQTLDEMKDGYDIMISSRRVRIESITLTNDRCNSPQGWVAKGFRWEMPGTLYEQRVTRTMSGFSTLPMCSLDCVFPRGK
jgi:hypothetical protein